MNRSSDKPVIKSYRSCRGFSYIEILIAAVVLSVLTVSAFRLFGNLGESSRALIDTDGAMKLALDMVTEMKSLRYDDSVNGVGLGPEADEVTGTRSQYDDIDDYNGWADSPAQRKDGTSYGSPLLTRTVEVIYVASNDFNSQVGFDDGFKKVTITVSDHTQRVLAQHVYIFPDSPGPIAQ